jgi:hypothetical protein
MINKNQKKKQSSLDHSHEYDHEHCYYQENSKENRHWVNAIDEGCH